MSTFATNRCPYCRFSRAWRIRREKRKCKRCRREWSIAKKRFGIRATDLEWQACVLAFLRERAARSVSRETGLGYTRTVRMLHQVRLTMQRDTPMKFDGICEADETFIGGQRKNKRLHIRRIKAKRGHGTDKIPIVGVLSRSLGQVRVTVVPVRCEATVIGFIRSCLGPEAILYTDAYKMNRAIQKYGVRHEYVDHDSGEYVRGDIHTNQIEGFWGILKRTLAMIGGIRRDRFPLFIGEIVWRYNYRKLSRVEQGERILKQLLH